MKLTLRRRKPAIIPEGESLPIDKSEAQATCRHQWYMGRCWRCDVVEYTNVRAEVVVEPDGTVSAKWVWDESVGPGVFSLGTTPTGQRYWTAGGTS